MLFRAWISIKYPISSEVKQHSYQHDHRQVKRLGCERGVFLWGAVYPLVSIALSISWNVTDLGVLQSDIFANGQTRERPGLCLTLLLWDRSVDCRPGLGVLLRRPTAASSISLKRLQQKDLALIGLSCVFLCVSRAGETSVADGVIVFWSLFGQERGRETGVLRRGRPDGCESCDYFRVPMPGEFTHGLVCVHDFGPQ